MVKQTHCLFRSESKIMFFIRLYVELQSFQLHTLCDYITF